MIFLKYINYTFSPFQSIPETTVDSGGSCLTLKDTDVSKGTILAVF